MVLAPYVISLAASTQRIPLGIGALVLLLWTLARRKAYMGFLLVPFLVVVLVVVALMIWVGDRPPEAAVRYGLLLAWAALLSLLIVLTTGIVDLAYGLELLMRPLRALGLNPRALSLGIVIAVRLFVLLFGAIGTLRRAFDARGIRLTGFTGMYRMAMATLLKLNQATEDLSVALILRGVDLDGKQRLVVRQYSFMHSAAFMLATIGFLLVMTFP